MELKFTLIVTSRRRRRSHDYLRRSPRRTEAHTRTVKAPTLIVWGEPDGYLRPALADPEPGGVEHLERVVRHPDASHSVQQDAPDRVSQLLLEFLRP